MNKFGLLIALFAFTLMSCTNQSNKQANENQETTTLDESMVDSQSSEMSLDWAGVYQGIMPCEDCEGIETVIELKDDHTYVAHYTYIGKPEGDNKITFEGTFTWGTLGSIITLQSESVTTQYKVGENQLMLLNTAGDIITGDLAEMYVLKKKM